MHRKKQGRGGGGGGHAVKRPVRAPGPLKRPPVFANQVPFRFDPATDAWVEVDLPSIPSIPSTSSSSGRAKPAKKERRPATRPTKPQPDINDNKKKEEKEEKEEEEKEERHEEEEEEEGKERPSSSSGGEERVIRVCTMNVLFDMYDNERIQTKRRMPALIELLRNTDADIIGLQEVTQPFLIRLLREEWVKRDYFVSDGPLGYSLKPYYGQLILSKIPFHRLITHQFSKSKKVTIAQFMIGGHPVWVPVVHLTSNRKGSDLYNKRHLQLQVIFEKVCPTGEPPEEKIEVWMMGDYNFEDGEEDRGLPPQWTQFVDVWPTLHPSEPGYTYDPQRNAIAASTTSSGKSRRIDRVMLRSGAHGPRWEPKSIELIGTAPLPDSPEGEGLVIFPSDHFGLVATIGTTSSPITAARGEEV